MIQHMRKDVMMKSLIKVAAIGGITALVGGCLVLVEHPSDRGSHYTHFPGVYDVWFNDAAVYCEYSVGDQISHWTLVANPDTTYGPDEIEDVYASIEGSELYSYNTVFSLAPVAQDEWRVSFDNIGSPENSYHCANSYDFLFRAYDYADHPAAEWVVW